MRYASSRLEQEERERAYRIYVTDSLKAMLRLNVRYAEVYENKPRRPEITAKKAIANIKAKFGV